YRPLFALLDDNGRVEPGPVAEFAETGTHGEKIRGRRNLERYIWSHLNKQQVGAYAEYYVKMELTMYGFQVYGTEVDDRGIDFIARFNHGPFFEFQVKSLRSYGYVFIPKNKFEPYENRFLAFGFLVDSYPPDLYLVPSVAWKNCNDLFVSRDYPGLKSSPEWGMNLSKKNSPLLEPYRFEPMVKNILENQQTLKISL
ncbi:MAG TPA: hypothetical protein PK528_08445, partial [Syntrophorhabdus sp.]|nr:hypothetical protein [Syntrophorhabdus sp.]